MKVGVKERERVRVRVRVRVQEENKENNGQLGEMRNRKRGDLSEIIVCV